MNVCRVCVVEVEGARALVPRARARPRRAWSCRPTRERVRTSRRLVLELLASSVDLSHRARRARYIGRYGAEPERFGGCGDRRAAGEGRQRPLRARLSRCILCYKCVEACGEDHQNTFAIAVAGRGFDAHISTEFDVPLPDRRACTAATASRVCPTGALMPRASTSCARPAPGTRRSRRRSTRSARTAASAATDAARAGQRHREGDLARRPRRDARQPLHQGPLRLPVHAELAVNVSFSERPLAGVVFVNMFAEE